MEIPHLNPTTSMAELQMLQRDYDLKYLTHNKGDFDDVRHTFEHLVKLTGKMATYIEQTEHGIEVQTAQLKDEVIPDLLIHALHLASVFHLPLEGIYQKRLEDNIKRIESSQ